MEIQLGENVFPLRADMLAIKNALEEHGVAIEKLDDGSLVQVGTLVYHFAKRGCAVRRVQFDQSLDDFLGLIEVSQVQYLGEIVSDLLGAGEEKKR